MKTSPNIENKTNVELRLLLLMPTGRDALLVAQTLNGADLSVEICADFQHLKSLLEEGCGAVLLAEEALKIEDYKSLFEVIETQPVWSDIPVILLAGGQQNSEMLLKSVGTRLNITILERPLPKAILISAVRSVIRARSRQYQTRNLLIELEEADHQKDVFLATLSHELRTPLNSMLGWIELLKDENNGVDQKHALRVIERSAKAQTQIISDILLLSRVVTGKFEIIQKHVNLSEVLRSAIDIVMPLIREKGIILQTAFEKFDDLICGDADRLQQVFWNLLSNAVKFTPANGIIKVTLERSDLQAIITVSDNGQGINSDFLPYIFEQFRQADNTYARNVGGLGLGLAIVRNIVEQHGGKVFASSEGAGNGATFQIYLPLIIENKKKDINKEMSAADKKEKSLSGLRILIAEDDADSREMLTYILEQRNIKIESVSTAAAAFSSFTANPPQIFISDVGMPDMDGYELLQKIRRLPPEKGGNVPAIALTGYVSQEDRARSSEVGFQAHLAKPIDFDQLFETIEKVAQL